MDRTDKFLPIIQRADPEEIESARERVTSADLAWFAETYKSLPTWEQKAALINLVQDHMDLLLRPMMFDFLGAPDIRDDTYELTKAIALCHLEGNFERFMVYYNDRRLLREKVNLRLQDVPRAMEPPRAIRRTKPVVAPQKTDWWSVSGIVLLLLGLLMMIAIFINQGTLAKYRAKGVTVDGRVSDRWKDDNSNCIEVSYFTKSIWEGGDLYFAEVCQFVDADDYRIGQHVEVVFVPDDPRENTILAEALENERLKPGPQYALGLLPIAVGIGLLVLRGVIGLLKRVTKD